MLNEIEIVSPNIERVSDLSNRPNYPLTYGGDGMSATALKARFDALPVAVRDKVNQLIQALSAHGEQVSGASYIGIAPQSYNEGRVTANSVADLVAALEDTGLAQLLKVHMGERICSLQECLQQHTEQLKRNNDILWTIQDGILLLAFPDGQLVEIPYASQPKVVVGQELVVEDHAKYLLSGAAEINVQYPSLDAVSTPAWSDTLGRYCSEILTFVDEHTAVGSSMFGTQPDAGALCIVILNDGEPLPLAIAVKTADDVSHIHFADMEVTISPAMEGVDVKVCMKSETHQIGEKISLFLQAYKTFTSDLRVFAGENGMTVRFPPSLYTGEVPEFSPFSVWDIHLNGGVLTAHRAMQESDAAVNGTLRVEQALEVIANGAY